MKQHIYPLRTKKLKGSIILPYFQGINGDRMVVPFIFWALFPLVLLTGCGGNDQKPEAQQGPPPKVKVAYPLRREVSEWDEFTGRIEAVDSVEVRARVSGYLEKINFVAGQKVKKGDLLFLIDPKPFQAQLNLTQAELERTQTKRELAKNDLARAEGLLKAKAISGEEYDSRNKGYREAVAAVRAAEASVYAARLNLQYCEILAPIDGRVGRELITQGNLVNGGGEATLLTTIVSTDPLYVYVDADERSILRYKRQHGPSLEGVEAQLEVADEEGFPHHGRIDYIAPSADPETGTVKLRGVFANADELLSPGFFARMRIRASEPYNALLLPDRALATDQAQRFVWVLNQEDKAEYRRITPGAHVGNLRVIKEGLTGQDRVVIEGLQKIRPGVKVSPEQITVGGEQ
ncbi:efflux RND transporter periplasmic adaptor subunit [Methylomarinum vadi]|uniref:efflux RND transporter periplasmic adaptor subunit n=1 Tax=Methylomarinum vadi TaxID=438855 RepID=UPI0009FD57FF|nr:efflux RND transporter periplasmic adaptor subunit [Methylomarinum vadi]